MQRTVFGHIGFNHPKHLNFYFPKASATPAVSDFLLPEGVRKYVDICKSNSWLFFYASVEVTCELRRDIKSELE